MFQYRKRFLSKTYWNYIREIVLPILQPEQQQQREESEHTLKKGSNKSVKKTSNIGLLKRIKNGIRSNVDNKARRSTALDIKRCNNTLSLVSISLALLLRFSAPPKCQNQLPEERGTMNTQITETIKDEILKWPGITTEPNRFGRIEFLVNKKEMGHLHGERLADLPFAIEIRKELVASGRALPHHIYPESGWVSYWIRNSGDILAVVKQ